MIRIPCKLIIALMLFSFITQKGIANENTITLEKIWNEQTFVPRGISLGKSMADGEHYTLVEDQHKINMYEYATGKLVRTIFNLEGLITNDEGDTPRIDNYYFDNDEKQILIAVNSESIYRHSSQSDFLIADIENNTITPLSENGKQRLATFSPNGQYIAFVRDNNIFLTSVKEQNEKQVTFDGKINHIINGTADWVYEEEFGFTKGFQWSPDSRKIAYYRFDESHVKEFVMLLYGSLYPQEYRFKYPKAGEENAHVSIHVYNLTTGNTLKLDTGEETDQYIPRIRWTRNADKIAVYRLNRHQNHLEILAFDVAGGNQYTLYEEKNKYYIDINDHLYFTKDGERFILSSEKSGYRHLYLYTIDGDEIGAITKGSWDINSFLGFDETRNLIYFTSYEQSPMQNHLYCIAPDGSEKKLLTPAEGWHSPSFSEGFRYFINNHTTINTPPVYSIHHSSGERINILEDNAELKEKLASHRFGDVTFMTVPGANGVELNTWILFPPDFDPDKEYPLFMYVYGGPDSQTVTHRWNTYNGAWFQMLAQMGYVVVSVDNRGTGARGEEFRKLTYMQLGKYETQDLIEAATFLGQLPFIDDNRIGIFGWSYGGYLSSLSLALGNDVFDAAIAVAPVTSWRFYDTVYTERYMRTPQENPEGYDNNSPINHVDKIRGAYLLVHGSADDNVHYQNTMEMADALIEANVDFDLNIYPNHNHGIFGGNARLHLYRLMTRFLEENL